MSSLCIIIPPSLLSSLSAYGLLHPALCHSVSDTSYWEAPSQSSDLLLVSLISQSLLLGRPFSWCSGPNILLWATVPSPFPPDWDTYLALLSQMIRKGRGWTAFLLSRVLSCLVSAYFWFLSSAFKEFCFVLFCFQCFIQSL